MFSLIQQMVKLCYLLRPLSGTQTLSGIQMHLTWTDFQKVIIEHSFRNVEVAVTLSSDIVSQELT